MTTICRSVDLTVPPLVGCCLWNRIMYVKLVIGKKIVNIVSAYAPQVGLSAEEKDDFWDSFIIVLSGIPKQESIFIGSNMNGHVGRDADRYGGVHGGIGFGTRNAEGEMILEFGSCSGHGGVQHILQEGRL